LACYRKGLIRKAKRVKWTSHPRKKPASKKRGRPSPNWTTLFIRRGTSELKGNPWETKDSIGAGRKQRPGCTQCRSFSTNKEKRRCPKRRKRKTSIKRSGGGFWYVNNEKWDKGEKNEGGGGEQVLHRWGGWFGGKKRGGHTRFKSPWVGLVSRPDPKTPGLI